MVLTANPLAEKIWRGSALALLSLLLVTAVIDLLDDIPIGGADFWTRLVKFQLSLAVHFITLALVVQGLNGAWRGNRLLGILAAFTAAGAVGEVAWIMVQAVRHELTTFTLSITTIQRFVYGVMGAGAVAAVASAFVVGLVVAFDARARMVPAHRLGIVVGLVGGALLTMLVGLTLGSRGGGHVGIHPPDGAVVPFAGWSLVVGDLRAPYFFALHTMQIVPLAGYVISRRLTGWRALLLVVLVAGLWMSLTLYLIEQALRGVPLLAA